MATAEDKSGKNIIAAAASAAGRPSQSLVESLLREMRDNSVAVARFASEVGNIREKVDSLSRVVLDGNGKGSMQVRISLLENDLYDLKREVDKNDKKIERLDDTSKHLFIEERKDVREYRAKRWGFWTAIAVAIISTVTTILTILLKRP